ncbi:hydrolase [Duganella sp. Leaf126]|uniref:alpha/beta fold hydrolase n=1 Tax=Duganella sp. Leaf126 TaxID=1736266 RepID=UPI0006F713AB|nr:alpha/beta hydrolase [Duganella sp. Leaf126]KQQ40390.1 hydrolase [Duganella sp. Leaf126]
MTDQPTRLDLIPGTLCDERMWARVAPLLGDFALHHVPLPQARTRAQMHELIASHSASKTNLVGFSLGAYLAVEYAVAHPERIGTLVLIANSCKGLPPAEIAARQRIVTILEKNVYTGMTRQRLRELLHPDHVTDTAITGPIEQMAVDLGKEVLLAQFVTTIDRVDYMDRLHTLPFPVLIVGAEGDQLVPVADLRAMAARLPDATLALIAEPTGHMIPLEAPAPLAALLHQFYSKLSAP